jgi:hypothetical protein
LIFFSTRFLKIFKCAFSKLAEAKKCSFKNELSFICMLKLIQHFSSINFIYTLLYSVMVHLCLMLELLQHCEESLWNYQAFLFLLITIIFSMVISVTLLVRRIKGPTNSIIMDILIIIVSAISYLFGVIIMHQIEILLIRLKASL